MPQFRLGELLIRDARIYDSKQLLSWWTDGRVMAHAGFPKGLKTSLEAIQARLEKQQTNFESDGLWMIEHKRQPIGEMHHRLKGEAASIGIKLCVPEIQGQGLGPQATKLLMTYLFERLKVNVINVDTNVNNVHAQKMYERLGFKPLGVRAKAFVDQHGQLQDAIDYRLLKEDWLNNKG